MKPTSKTPYEIRLELLQLAQTILASRHLAAAHALASNPATVLVMTAPTTAEIIAEADVLNAFVSKANPNH